MSDQTAKDHPNVIMLPPLIVLIVMAVAVVLDWVAGLSILPAVSLSSWSVYVGLVLVGAAAALVAWAIRTFAAAGTNVSPHLPAVKLTTAGPYRLTRNPMYVSLLLLYSGLSLILSLEWGLILAPVLALILHYGVVLREERYLTGKFGQAYRDFTSRTRRWL